MTDPPDGVLGWAVFAVGTLLLAVVGAGRVEWLGNVLMALPYKKIIAFVVVMAVTATVGYLAAAWLSSVRLGPCDPPAQVRVLTTPELVGPYRALANEFEESAAEVLEALIARGYPKEQLPSERTMRDILNRMNYRLKRIQKGKPLKKTPETDAIFANVKQVREQARKEPDTLEISMDAKAKVALGDYSRGGKNPDRCRG